MKPGPRDAKLYASTKRAVYEKYPKHSAYRSGILVQTYKNAFSKKYGKAKNPYTGKKPVSTGLTRWFMEEWKSDKGTIGYPYKSSVYRPTKRITKDTPKTFSEIDKKTLKRAKRMKAAGKRAEF